MNHRQYMIGLTPTGATIHLVVDSEANEQGIFMLTACGKVMECHALLAGSLSNVSCTRCRSVNLRLGKGLGMTLDEATDTSEEIPF